MPNWIVNKISVDKDVDKIKEKLCTDNEVDFNNIIPMPDNIYQGPLGKKEKELYGENNWYDWSIKNWGVKWNACDTYLNKNEIWFNTPWDGVPKLIYELAKQFPESKFKYIFADEDMFRNTGIFEFKGEDILRVDYNDYNYAAYKTYMELNDTDWMRDYNIDYRVYVTRDGDTRIVRVIPIRRLVYPVKRLK